MKRVLLFLAIAELTSMVTFGQKKETRTVSGFTGIDASGAFDITVVKDSTEALTIEADEAVMQYVRSEVKKGVLHLYLDNTKKVKNIKTLKVKVVMKNLDRATLSGAYKLTANGGMTVEMLSVSEYVKLSNSGNVNLSLPANNGYQLKVKANKIDTSNLKDFRGNMDSKSLDGTVGNGGAKIEINTSQRASLKFK